jgi:hypothetical protein
MVILSMTEQLLAVEGCFAFCFCLTVYLLSATSLGKRSFTHAWLFTNLQVLTPTQASVKSALLTPKTSNRKGSHDSSLEERLKKLHFNVTTLRPGSLTLAAMHRREATVLWKALDTAIVWILSCGVAIAGRWLSTTFRQLYHSCCSDFDCWVADWSAGQRSTLLLAVLTILSFRSWLQMALLASQMPIGLRASFSPSCYVSGFLVGLSVWWMTSQQQSQIASSTIGFWDVNMNIPDTHLAIQELASRSMLWLHLFDARMDLGHDVFQWFVFFWRLVLAGLGAVLGFSLAEPLQALQYRIFYRWHVGDLNSGEQTSSSNKSSPHSLRSLYQGVVAAGVAGLPVLILLSYNHSDPAMVMLRASAAWILVLLLFTLSKTLLQDYLQQALLHVVSTLARPLGSNPGDHDNDDDDDDDDDSTAITHPFTSRYENLVRLGSQLVTFPLLVVILLTAGHLCNFSSQTPMYPCAYGIPFANAVQHQTWEQQKVQAMAQSVLHNAYSPRRLWDSKAESCEITPTLSLSASKKSKKDAVSNPVELLANRATSASAGTSPESLIQILQKIQLHAKYPEESRGSSSEPENSIRDFKRTAQALVRHPFLTSSIVHPLIDLMGFVLCSLWTLSFIQRLILYWKPMRALRLHSLQLSRKPVHINKDE